VVHLTPLNRGQRPFWAILEALVEAYSAPRFHHGRLRRGMGALEPEAEGSVLRVAKPVHSFSLERGDLRGDICEVSSYVAGDVCVVFGSRFPVSAYTSQDIGLGALLSGRC
jgi:hypothetical protein